MIIQNLHFSSHVFVSNTINSSIMMSIVIKIRVFDKSGKHLSVKVGESCGYVECRITYAMRTGWEILFLVGSETQADSYWILSNCSGNMTELR